MYTCIHTPESVLKSVMADWPGMLRESRVRGSEIVKARRHLEDGKGQFLERQHIGKLRSYFHATLTYNQPSTLGLRQRSLDSIVKANNQCNGVIIQEYVLQA